MIARRKEIPLEQLVMIVKKLLEFTCYCIKIKIYPCFSESDLLVLNADVKIVGFNNLLEREEFIDKIQKLLNDLINRMPKTKRSFYRVIIDSLNKERVHSYMKLLQYIGREEEVEFCCICMDNFLEIKLPCHHSPTCMKCFTQVKQCPLCRADYNWFSFGVYQKHYES